MPGTVLSTPWVLSRGALSTCRPCPECQRPRTVCLRWVLLVSEGRLEAVRGRRAGVGSPLRQKTRKKAGGRASGTRPGWPLPREGRKRAERHTCLLSTYCIPDDSKCTPISPLQQPVRRQSQPRFTRGEVKKTRRGATTCSRPLGRWAEGPGLRLCQQARW